MQSTSTAYSGIEVQRRKFASANNDTKNAQNQAKNRGPNVTSTNIEREIEGENDGIIFLKNLVA